MNCEIESSLDLACTTPTLRNSTRWPRQQPSAFFAALSDRTSAHHPCCHCYCAGRGYVAAQKGPLNNPVPDLCYLCLGAPRAVDVPAYRITVCAGCWSKAEAGWPEEFEPSLFAALKRAGLLIPDRNGQGRLPREYRPPADFHL